MPKLQTSPIADTLFRLDGLDYGKNQYQLVYNNVQQTGGVVDEAIIQVGLFTRDTQKYLVQPTPVNTWKDSSDAPYASMTALITALEEIVGFDAGGGGGSGVNIYNSDGVIPEARTVTIGEDVPLVFEDGSENSIFSIVGSSSGNSIAMSAQEITMDVDGGTAIRIEPSPYYGPQTIISNPLVGHSLTVGDTGIAIVAPLEITGNVSHTGNFTTIGDMQVDNFIVSANGGGIIPSLGSAVNTTVSATDQSVNSGICWDSDFIYVNTSFIGGGSSVWKKIALTAI